MNIIPDQLKTKEDMEELKALKKLMKNKSKIKVSINVKEKKKRKHKFLTYLK